MQARHRYVAILAVVALVILVVGFFLRPTPPPTPTKRVSAELTVTHAELDNLRDLVQRNSLRNVAADFSALADRVFSQVATVRPWGSGAIVLPGGDILAPKLMDRLPQTIALTSGDGPPHPLAVTSWIPGVPFLSATIQASNDFSPATLARAFPIQGSWLLLVTDGVNRPALVSPGVFSGISDAHCGPFLQHQLQTTIPLTPATIGAGVFDLSGSLQGIVAQCDDSISILGIGDIQRALTDASSATLLVRYGMRLSPAASSTGSTANTPNNMLVGELWTGWPADSAGLQAGDALLSINGQNIANIDQTVAALTAQGAASFRLRVRRAQRIFFADMKPVQLAAADAAPQSALELEPSGMRLLHVAPGSSAAAAGIRPDDIVLRVGDLPATSERVNSVLGSYRVSAPVSAVIWRPGRELLVWIQP